MKFVELVSKVEGNSKQADLLNKEISKLTKFEDFPKLKKVKDVELATRSCKHK